MKSEIILNVPEEKHTRMVVHARELLKKKNEIKWEICRIALEICYIPPMKGGRYDNRYSITNFAEDIGMHRKTLSCWILDYQCVYLKIQDIVESTSSDYSDQKKLMGAISKTRAKLFNLNEISKDELDKIDNQTVYTEFKEQFGEDPLISRINAFIKNISHQTYTMEHQEWKPKHLQILQDYREKLEELTKMVRMKVPPKIQYLESMGGPFSPSKDVIDVGEITITETKFDRFCPICDKPLARKLAKKVNKLDKNGKPKGVKIGNNRR